MEKENLSVKGRDELKTKIVLRGESSLNWEESIGLWMFCAWCSTNGGKRALERNDSIFVLGGKLESGSKRKAVASASLAMSVCRHHTGLRAGRQASETRFHRN